MAARVHRTLKVIAFNADVIFRWRYELIKQLQDLYETHLKSHGECIPYYHFYRPDGFPGRQGFLHNHIDLCYMCDTYT
jgi:hypothetical protein